MKADMTIHVVEELVHFPPDNEVFDSKLSKGVPRFYFNNTDIVCLSRIILYM